MFLAIPPQFFFFLIKKNDQKTLGDKAKKVPEKKAEALTFAL